MTAPDWEEVGCLLCGAGLDASSGLHEFPEAWYRGCRECGLVYLSPRLREERMLAWYQTAAYFSGDHALGYDDYASEAPAQRATFGRRLDEIGVEPGARLLDVGCGPGLLVDVALERGIDAFGIDVSDSAIASRPDRVDRLQVGNLGELAFPDARFDLITLMDVFEHLYDPQSFVRELRRVLAPGGRVAIATPDYDSWMRRILGRRTVSFKIPEHVAYYTRETLERAVAPAFRIASVRPIGQYCSADFLAARLGDLHPWLGTVASVVGGLPPLSGRFAYVPSGSLLAVLTRSP